MQDLRSGDLSIRLFVVVDSFDLIVVAHARLAIHIGLQPARRIEELGVLEGLHRSSGHQVPGLTSLNIGLSRWIVIREQTKLQLRLETLNSTNTAQFSNPNTGFGSNFEFITGTISSGTGVNGTGGGRVVQLGAKMVF
jgi:hypothetical protein